MSKMNIIYLHSHDTGRYIQPYGYAVPTPNLQRLAEEGVLFRQAFCVNPTCSASRAGLLTGTWPHCNGMVGLAHRGSRLNDYSKHMASYLRTQGYTTVLGGQQHEIKDDEAAALGYSKYLPAFLKTDEFRAPETAAFLEQSPAEPFFLSIGFWATHRKGKGVNAHNLEGEWLGDPRYVRPPATLPDTPQTRRDFADYVVAAGRLDQMMGQILAALERSGLAEKTLVICTTDHGIAFPQMKCNLTDHGLGVNLIIRGPAGFRGGKVIDSMVTHLDLFPTICQAAGIEAPSWLQGKSLLPLLDGRTPELHEAIFAEVNYHAAYEPMRAVRTTRYKYIRLFDPQPHPVLSNIDDSLSKNELVAAGWGQHGQQSERLYDLVFDPNESCDLSPRPSAAPVLAEMRQRLDQWMRDTKDPLLSGSVAPWPGMIISPRDGRSPQSRMI